jgi:hypothetical protein
MNRRTILPISLSDHEGSPRGRYFPFFLGCRRGGPGRTGTFPPYQLGDLVDLLLGHAFGGFLSCLKVSVAPLAQRESGMAIAKSSGIGMRPRSEQKSPLRAATMAAGATVPSARGQGLVNYMSDTPAQ